MSIPRFVGVAEVYVNGLVLNSFGSASSGLHDRCSLTIGALANLLCFVVVISNYFNNKMWKPDVSHLEMASIPSGARIGILSTAGDPSP